MKKKTIIWLIVLGVVLLCGIALGIRWMAGGIVLPGATKMPDDPSPYTEEDIEAAMRVATDYFGDFRRSIMVELEYSKEWTEREQSYRSETEGFEGDVIVLKCKYLNNTRMKEGFSWIIVRENDGEWRHLTHGYG